MRAILMAAVAAMVATPALAGDCDGWRAGMEEDEGGPTMTATICAADRPDDLLLIVCGGEDKIGLRYLPSVGDDYPPGGNMDYATTFVFAAGADSAEIELGYEAMDGALTATPRRDSALVRLLKSAGPLTVTDKAGILPPDSFVLKGSSKAIGKVENACYS